MNIWQKTRQWFADGVEIISAIAKSMSGDPLAWESSIRKFEAQDRLKPPLADVIVFTGSSSITFWATLEQDMAPLPVINRGFGGSRINDVVYYADRIVIPYHPRAVVLFAGTNDIAGRKPKTAQEVFEGYCAFVKTVHAALPQTPIYYISTTPTPSRWKHWPIVREANRLIQAQTETDPRLHYIDLTDVILGLDGKPRRDLYRIDRLHPNKKGYAQWTAIIKPILQAEL
jgi:lysophospholipase L1-like esterase